MVRWNHPQHGLLGPFHFIHLADADAQLANSLSKYVIQKVIKDWRDANIQSIFSGKIAINLSPIGLYDHQFPDQLEQWVSRHSHLRSQLLFEITETSSSVEPANLHDVMARLRIKGYQLSIDDFGTGYSSFDNLRRYPVNELKIDMSFVQSAIYDPTSKIIVEKSVILANELNLRSVAEGVETVGQWRWLQEIGCDAAQGYFIAKPMPIDVIFPWHEDWIKSKHILF